MIECKWHLFMVSKIKIILLLICLSVALCGCNNYPDLKNPREVDLGNLDGYSDIEINYLLKYKTFEELFADPNAFFYYGKIINVSNFNSFFDKYQLEVYLPVQQEKTLYILLSKGSTTLTINNSYVLHLEYNKSCNAFSLTQDIASVFFLDGSNFICPSVFVDSLDKSLFEKNNFLDFIFSKS